MYFGKPHPPVYNLSTTIINKNIIGDGKRSSVTKSLFNFYKKIF